MEESEPSYAVRGNLGWCSHLRNSMEVPQKMKLTYDLAIPLLGIYLNKTAIQKDTSTPLLTATRR